MSEQISKDLLLRWYEQMWTIRYFEDNAIANFRKGLFTGSTHPCICQEAICVGAAAALKQTDQVFATYRGHGHAIARGLDPKALMSELLCKETGCCGGRGGSMHLCDMSKDFWGTNAIVAAHIPIAAGVALSNKIRKNGRVVICFFGDGATCEGAFLETLNMATLWKVPLVMVCENNGFAISVPTRSAHSVEHLAQLADGFGLPGISIDGNDPQLVYQTVRAAAARARDGAGPTFIECKTVRWERHSAISAGKYADEEALNAWKRADPIPRLEKVLLEAGVSEDDLRAVRERAKRINDEANEFAQRSPVPNPQSAGDFVFA